MKSEELEGWSRTRRYAVPRRMIEQAAERRAAGDWRGACAAADVDVEIDPAHLTPDLEDDLRHLAFLRDRVAREHPEIGSDVPDQDESDA
ncbi:hypothetical protein ACQEU3_02775 [Spirillospora sp. CA-253888]